MVPGRIATPTRFAHVITLSEVPALLRSSWVLHTSRYAMTIWRPHATALLSHAEVTCCARGLGHAHFAFAVASLLDRRCATSLAAAIAWRIGVYLAFARATMRVSPALTSRAVLGVTSRPSRFPWRYPSSRLVVPPRVSPNAQPSAVTPGGARHIASARLVRWRCPCPAA